MNEWSTDSNWYYVSSVLAFIAVWLWRDLRDSNQRKKHLGELAKKLSDRVYELEAEISKPVAADQPASVPADTPSPSGPLHTPYR